MYICIILEEEKNRIIVWYVVLIESKRESKTFKEALLMKKRIWMMFLFTILLVGCGTADDIESNKTEENRTEALSSEDSTMQPQKPGTMPSVDNIEQPSQEKIGQEKEVGLCLYAEGTFVYYFNASTKSERLVLIEYPKEIGEKEAELIVVEPSFGGWTGLRQALEGTFQAKLLAVKNISFEEGMYAHNATLPGSGMEKYFAEGEIVKDLDMLVNNNTEQVYVGALYNQKPSNEAGAVFIAISEEYVTILTNASDSVSDALESNLKVYERIYERFGLTSLFSHNGQ